MSDESTQAMVIMATVAMKAYGEVVGPTARSIVGSSLKAVSALAKEGERALELRLRGGETAMRALEQQGNVKFMDSYQSDLESYRSDLRARGVRFNVENLGDGKARLWYVASDAEKIKAAIIDAGARFVAREQGVSAIEQQSEAPSAVRVGAYEMDRSAFDEWVNQAVSAADRNFRDAAVRDEEISTLIENSLAKPEGSRIFEFEGEKFDVDKALTDGRIKEAAVDKDRADVPLESAAWKGGENMLAQNPPTPEQNAAIADMKGAGRIGYDVNPATVGEAHEAISGVLERESKGAPTGGCFASVHEAIAFIQGKSAVAMEKLGDRAAKAAERGAEKAVGEVFER